MSSYRDLAPWHSIPRLAPSVFLSNIKRSYFSPQRMRLKINSSFSSLYCKRNASQHQPFRESLNFSPFASMIYSMFYKWSTFQMLLGCLLTVFPVFIEEGRPNGIEKIDADRSYLYFVKVRSACCGLNLEVGISFFVCPSIKITELRRFLYVFTISV